MCTDIACGNLCNVATIEKMVDLCNVATIEKMVGLGKPIV